MATNDSLKPIHVFAIGVEAALCLFWLALHVLAYWHPMMPAVELYKWYRPLDKLYNLLVPIQVVLGVLLVNLFFHHPKGGRLYYVIFVCWGFYVLFCWFNCNGQVGHSAAGWFGYGKHGSHPLTEEQAFQGMWKSIRAYSAVSLAIAFPFSYIITASCIITLRKPCFCSGRERKRCQERKKVP